MTSKIQPNFFILGAAKAGTTALYDTLTQHPQIYLSFMKEPMFFSHDENYQRGIDWYLSTFFEGSENYPVRGEATPHYLYWAEKTAPRLAQQFQDNRTKFIICLRDPVSRAYSWYWNMIKEGKENLPFYEALLAEEFRLNNNHDQIEYSGAMTFGYQHGSDYLRQINEFLKYFPREQFYFILQDDIRNTASISFSNLLSFLEIDPHFQPQKLIANQAKLPRIRRVHSLLHDRSVIKEILKRILPLKIRYKVKTFLRNANMQTFSYPPMDENSKNLLREQLTPQIAELEQITGLDLSNWK